jgi:serine/threonine protein kinase/tetratricopeptide (TPR) repeat protein
MINRLVSHYKIIEKLGEGGMGIVYKAEDTRLARIVAIKTLLPHLVASPEEKERFLHEARAAAALTHPNIATIYTIEEFDSQLFIVMEYINGEELREIIHRRPLEPRQAIEIALQIAEGLVAAHDHGIIHRDLKPANIKITEKGIPKIMDFGLAKLLRAKAVTSTSNTLGTLMFMSPEQLRGEDVDHTTDIWSLGVILYEMVTGYLPFYHEYESAVFYSIINESPVPPTEHQEILPYELERIILRCLRKQREERYQSAKQLIADIQAIKSSDERSGKIYREERRARKEIERKRATILFVSITGISEILDRSGPETVAAILNTGSEIIETVARKYIGTINKISESTFRILFGLPDAIERASYNALSTAIEIRQKVIAQKNNRNIPDTIHFNIGINTGIVLAGSMGAVDTNVYNVIGDPVEIAHTLMAHAVNGRILVSSTTYRETRNDFQYNTPRITTYGAKKKPLSTYELLPSEKAGIAPRDIRRTLTSDLIGRTKELDALELHLLKAINGQGSIISIMGEPGLGKTRLITEFKKITGIQRVSLLEGHAVSHGASLSFHPIIETLKKWAGVEEDDSEKTIVLKLEKLLHSVYPEGAADTLPYLSLIMGIAYDVPSTEKVKDITGEALVKLTQKNIRDLFIKATDQRPVLCIIEDVHWADLSTLDLLQSLFRTAAEHPIMFVVTLRPNYQDTGDRLLTALKDRYHNLLTEIRLEPLNEEDSLRLISQYIKVPDLPGQIREIITARSVGNPFFIEEVLHSFIDEGALEIDGGHIRITEKIHNVTVPDTIQDMLAARVDRLDDTAKSLLKIASVIGKTFSKRIISKIVERDKNIDDVLERLKSVQLILEYRKFEDIEYQFKHALLHEVVYETIPPNKCKELHLRVASAIEQEFHDRIPEFYGMLAYHFSHAEELTKAEEYLLKAGDQTLKKAASHEALRYFEDALKLYMKIAGVDVDPGKLARLEKNIGMSLYNKGHLVDSVEHFEKALIHLEQKIYRHPISQNYHLFIDMLAMIKAAYMPVKRSKKPPSEKDSLIFTLRFRKANALANFAPRRTFMDLLGAIRVYLTFDVKNEEACELYSIAGALFAFGGISFSIGRKLIEKAKLYQTDDTRSRLIFRFHEKLVTTLSGDWNNEYRVDEDAVAGAIQKGEFIPTVQYLSWALYSIVARGDFDYANHIMDLLESINETYDFDYGRLYRSTYFISGNTHKRDLPAAVRAADVSIDYADKLDLHTWKIGLYGQKAYAQIFLNDLEGALESLQRSEYYLREAGTVAPMLRCYYTRAKFVYDLFEFENALLDPNRKNEVNAITELRRRAYRSGKKALGIIKFVAEMSTDTYLFLGRLYWLTRNYKKAVKFWNRSIATCERLGALPDLGRTYMEIGRRLSERKNTDRLFNGIGVEGYFEKARTIFTELNLQWDLHELDNIRMLAGR